MRARARVRARRARTWGGLTGLFLAVLAVAAAALAVLAVAAVALVVLIAAAVLDAVAVVGAVAVLDGAVVVGRLLSAPLTSGGPRPPWRRSGRSGRSGVGILIKASSSSALAALRWRRPHGRRLRRCWPRRLPRRLRPLRRRSGRSGRVLLVILRRA